MRRFKTALWILLTMAALVFFAFAPHIVSAILDDNTIGRVSLDPMVSPELKFRKNTPTLGKLAMLSQMDGTISIPEEKAQMTREQVMDAVFNSLRPYLDAQLIIYSEKDVEMYPHLIQVADHPELHSVVWIVMIHGDPKSFTFLDLVVDDETGKLLRVSYVAENGLLEGIPKVDLLSMFEYVFFSQLDIPDYAEALSTDLQESYIGEDALGNRYMFTSQEYGTILVDLFVYDHGFYVEFPGSISDRLPAAWDGPHG